MKAAVALIPLLAALAACQSLPPAGTPAGEVVGGSQVRAAEAAQQARIAALGLAGMACDAPVWAMSGRVALSNGHDGGSGRIDWTQGGGRTQVTLSAPVTRQSWTLTADAQGASLDGVPDGPVRGQDPGALLRSATGWEIPVAALGCWLRGAPADAAAMGPARLVYGTDLRPLRIEQGGWSIDFSDWRPDPARGADVPARINAERAANRVRLVVDHWDGQ